MKKVVISGYYGFNNTGDDSMIETFANYFKNNKIEVTFMSKNPKNTEKTFGVNAINRNNIFKIIDTIRKSDVLISGGGTLLQDITKLVSIWYYLFIILIGIMFKKEVYILFQGIGPINNKFNIWLTRKILSKVTYIVLRDQKAYDEMVKLEFDTSKTIVANDVVFALDIPTEHENIELIKQHIINYDIKQQYIGVSLRPWKNIRNEIEFAKILDEISKKYNAQIVFFTFHKSQDYNYTYRVLQNMNCKCHIISDEFIPSQIAGLMSLMKLNIGVRLHSLVFSVVVGIPTIGITYDPKVDGFLSEIGIKPACEYMTLDKEGIMSQVDAIYNGQYSQEVFEKVRHNREVVIKTLNDVMGGKYV